MQHVNYDLVYFVDSKHGLLQLFGSLIMNSHSCFSNVEEICMSERTLFCKFELFISYLIGDKRVNLQVADQIIIAWYFELFFTVQISARVGL